MKARPVGHRRARPAWGKIWSFVFCTPSLRNRLLANVFHAPEPQPRLLKPVGFRSAPLTCVHIRRALRSRDASYSCPGLGSQLSVSWRRRESRSRGTHSARRASPRRSGPRCASRRRDEPDDGSPASWFPGCCREVPRDGAWSTMSDIIK